MFGLANISGPILGGAFTQHLTWRWCKKSTNCCRRLRLTNPGFHINLPCGAVTVVLLLLFFHPKVHANTAAPLLEKLKHLGFPDFCLFAPAVIMLLLSLQWGGEKYPWNSATIIGMLCGFGGLIVLFMARQWHEQDEGYRRRSSCNEQYFPARSWPGLPWGVYSWYHIISRCGSR